MIWHLMHAFELWLCARYGCKTVEYTTAGGVTFDRCKRCWAMTFAEEPEVG